MSYLVSLTDAIDFAPATVVDEILQNVRTIISTPRGTVALHRDFGVDFGAVDAPMAQSQAMLSADLIAAIQRDEPRAVVQSVTWSRTAAGVLSPTVTISIP